MHPTVSNKKNHVEKKLSETILLLQFHQEQ